MIVVLIAVAALVVLLLVAFRSRDDAGLAPAWALLRTPGWEQRYALLKRQAAAYERAITSSRAAAALERRAGKRKRAEEIDRATDELEIEARADRRRLRILQRMMSAL